VMKLHFLLGKMSHAPLNQGLGTHPQCTKLFTYEGGRMQRCTSVACLQWQTRDVWRSRKTAAWCAQWLQQEWKYPQQACFTLSLTAREV
jgi:hypothetical protein